MFPNIIWWLVSALVSWALTPKPKTERPKAAGLRDFQLPTIAEGTRIPRLIGRRRIRAPIVAWYGDLVVEPIKQRGGKK